MPLLQPSEHLLNCPLPSEADVWQLPTFVLLKSLRDEDATAVQVVEETTTSALFSIAMVVVYDECVISEVRVLSSRTFRSRVPACSLYATWGPPCSCCLIVHQRSLGLAYNSCMSLQSGQSQQAAKLPNTLFSECRPCPKPFRTTHLPPSYSSMVLTFSLLSMCPQSIDQVNCHCAQYMLSMPRFVIEGAPDGCRPAGLSVLQQAAAFGYPSTVYEIRPKVPLCVPAWAWIIIAVAALALLVAGMSSYRVGL